MMSRPALFTRLSAPLRQLYLSRGFPRANRHLYTSLKHDQHAAALASASLQSKPSEQYATDLSEPTSPLLPESTPEQDSAALRPLLLTLPLPPSAQSAPGTPLDLPSFIAHALSTTSSAATSTGQSLSHPPPSLPTSPTFRGTLYEHTCAAALRSLGFALQRTGRRGDMGVDLLGHWHVPGRKIPMKCLVQCKNTAKKLGPSVIRELAGCFEGGPVGWRGGLGRATKGMVEGEDAKAEAGVEEEAGTQAEDGVAYGSTGAVAVLCASQNATKGVRDALRRAVKPMVWVMVGALDVEELETRVGKGESVDELVRHLSGGAIKQILWNSSAEQLGLSGVEVGWVHRVLNAQCEDEQVVRELRLLWTGRRWEPQFPS